jgi:hypothetical protein
MQTNSNFWLKTKNKVILKGTLDFALPKKHHLKHFIQHKG